METIVATVGEHLRDALALVVHFVNVEAHAVGEQSLPHSIAFENALNGRVANIVVYMPDEEGVTGVEHIVDIHFLVSLPYHIHVDSCGKIALVAKCHAKIVARLYCRYRVVEYGSLSNGLKHFVKPHRTVASCERISSQR